MPTTTGSHDIVYTRSDGIEQHLDVHAASSANGWPAVDDAVLIYLHGGGWRVGDKTSLGVASPLPSRGLTTISANYTLTPRSPYPRNVEDVFALIAYVDEHRDELGIGDAQIFLGGASAGAHLSALAVTKGLAEGRLAAPIAGVVSWYAPLDPPSRYLLHRYPPAQRPGGFWDRGLERGARGNDPYRAFAGTEDFDSVTLRQAWDADPRFHLDRIDPAQLPPFLLLVGSRDSAEIRYSQQTLFGALDWVGADVQLLTVEAADHEDARFQSPAVTGAVTGFIREALLRSAERPAPTHREDIA